VHLPVEIGQRQGGWQKVGFGAQRSPHSPGAIFADCPDGVQCRGELRGHRLAGHHAQHRRPYQRHVDPTAAHERMPESQHEVTEHAGDRPHGGQFPVAADELDPNSRAWFDLVGHLLPGVPGADHRYHAFRCKQCF